MPAPTKKKSAAKKPASKPVKKSAPKAPAKTSREEKLAAEALKIVDQAASLLRSGIRTGAQETEKSRLAARKKAHSLLTSASGKLSGLVADTSSVLHKAISKTLG